MQEGVPFKSIIKREKVNDIGNPSEKEKNITAEERTADNCLISM